MSMCIAKGVTYNDEPTTNYPPTLHFPSAVRQLFCLFFLHYFLIIVLVFLVQTQN